MYIEAQEKLFSRYPYMVKPVHFIAQSEEVLRRRCDDGGISPAIASVVDALRCHYLGLHALCGKGLGVTQGTFKVKRLGQRQVFRLVCVKGFLPALGILHPVRVLLWQLSEKRFIVKRLPERVDAFVFGKRVISARSWF